MAKTVNGAFNDFNKNYVNLDSDRTTKARSSRDWLIGQLSKFPENVYGFPKLYEGKHIKFGSFARNTKIRPLDDVDLIITFSAMGSTYSTIEYGKKYYLSVPETAEKLRVLCDDNGYLNSIKVVNKIVSALSTISQYSSANIHRRQEAATLKLTSYEWNFDIVPALYTDIEHYLIPDGNGHWKATNPKIDQDRTTSINQKHNGHVLQAIRTLKYWNRRANMTTIPSYLFENLVLNFFNTRDESSEYVDINIINFWSYLSTAIYSSVQDPKGFQGDINTLTFDEKQKISERANQVYKKGVEAYNAETKEDNHQKAINIWRTVWGTDFPQYN